MDKLNVQRLETTDLFQFSIFLLGTDKLRREMESAGKDKGKKKTEAGEINIALRASWKIESEKRLNGKDILELSCMDIRVCSHIWDTGFARLDQI